ncbi:uncharacterized protein G2W53_041860 [Senna tora]|uniref:Uncharacterized protein n=1 Tax=Senna tora TaxID=362788 RepID=A0A834SFV3_9FABA|nr:uncharacterized protein G2W53_041860 [Senna tora]
MAYYYTSPYPPGSDFAYSATTFSEPRLIEYDPNSEKYSQLVIYYNSTTLDFNEPDFDEYDPTPYGGGYDIVQTYGKPLPPSIETCHPLSGSDQKAIIPHQIESAGKVTDEMPQSSDEKAVIPHQIGSAGKVFDEMPQSKLRDLPEEEEESIHESQDLNPYEGEDIKEHEEKQVAPEYPSGYGLEAMDLCESLFGYWPCLARMRRNRENWCEEEEEDDDIGGGRYCCKENMWKGTADYLFGSPYPYGGRGEEGSGYGGEVFYGYQRQCPTQSQYKQIEYNGNSW